MTDDTTSKTVRRESNTTRPADNYATIPKSLTDSPMLPENRILEHNKLADAVCCCAANDLLSPC